MSAGVVVPMSVVRCTDCGLRIPPTAMHTSTTVQERGPAVVVPVCADCFDRRWFGGARHG